MARIPLIVSVALLIGFVLVDRAYLSRFKADLVKLERDRIVTANKLASAKIAYENLNHVRDLVEQNMLFSNQGGQSQENRFFQFLTSCANDLKIAVLDVKPGQTVTKGEMLCTPYDIELSGDFFSFGELCAQFENSRKIIDLVSFEASLAERSNDNAAGSMKIRVRLRVETFTMVKD